MHRLLQNKGDGKLVASAGNQDPDKMDSLQLEFTHTLTSQLEAQREYYEEKLLRFNFSIYYFCFNILKDFKIQFI